MKRKSVTSQLVVKDLVVHVNDKTILHGVNASATSGNLLAIMGPTGSGKTTLLNAIAGRIQTTSGNITLDGHNFNKQQRRRLGYVLQDDIFMSRLTLYETLYFTAMIHIPESVSWKEKQARITEIVDALHIKKCLHTIIGDMFNRGLSGGEKKRANIACELLTDPDLMLLDEPTSGLDSSTAHSLMIELRNYATHYNKTIIATIHQPSSQVYHLFCKLLLLMDGHVVYFGKTSYALNYFEKIGLSCAVHFNPADFLLALLTSNEETTRTILEAATLNRNFKSEIEIDDAQNENHIYISKTSTDFSNFKMPIAFPDKNNSQHSFTDLSSVEPEATSKTITTRSTWPTSFWTQYKMLSWRQFKQSKGHILDKMDVAQTIFTALVIGALYFQVDLSYSTLRDKMGVVFITTMHLGFTCLIITVTSFPAERDVIRKERDAGAYRLSAYYFAKMTSDLPLILIVPIIFLSIVYWMSAIGDGILFGIFIPVILLLCLCSQSIAHILGATFTDTKLSLTIGISFMLFSLFNSGYLNTHVPTWLRWAKYLSLFHYPFACLNILSTENLPPLWCNTTSVEMFPSCRGNTTFVTKEEVLKDFGIEIPFFCYIATLGIFLIISRILVYYILKYKR